MRRQNAAIVFIDLSGFTSLSERLGPDRVRELLKDFHALVDKEAVARGGTITSFLGDGAMILFGLPEAAADDAFGRSNVRSGFASAPSNGSPRCRRRSPRGWASRSVRIPERSWRPGSAAEAITTSPRPAIP